MGRGGGGGGRAGSEVWNRVYMIAPVKKPAEWDWVQWDGDNGVSHEDKNLSISRVNDVLAKFI